MREGDIEIGGVAEHVHQAPQGETPASILLQTKIDAHMFETCRERLGRKGFEIGGTEIALELIVEVHDDAIARFPVGRICLRLGKIPMRQIPPLTNGRLTRLPEGPTVRDRQGRKKIVFSHIVVGANDIEASRNFYDASLATLGVRPGRPDPKGRIFYMSSTGILIVTTPIDGQPACHANGGTIGFAAESPAVADAWHAAGLANGGTACEDPPGVREAAGVKLYLAYLRDPAGNKLCAMHRLPD
jgi:catechol 2,3-dioxygenase-like lactoylglutathione lyase family enzyme